MVEKNHSPTPLKRAQNCVLNPGSYPSSSESRGAAKNKREHLVPSLLLARAAGQCSIITTVKAESHSFSIVRSGSMLGLTPEVRPG